MDEVEAEKRILSLASAVLETDDAFLPEVLLGIQDLLDACPLGSAASRLVKRQVVDYQLANVCVDAVAGLDFARCRGGWRAAGRLALLLVNCFVGCEPSDLADFKQQLLPAAALALVSLMQRIQQRYSHCRQLACADAKSSATATMMAERKELQTALVNVGDALGALCSWRRRLATVVMGAAEWPAIIACQSPSLGAIALGVLLKMLALAAAPSSRSSGKPSLGDALNGDAAWAWLDALVLRVLATGSGASSEIATSAESLSQEKSSRGNGRRANLACQTVGRLLSAGVVARDAFGERYRASYKRVLRWRDCNGCDDVALTIVSKPLRRAIERSRRAELRRSAATSIQARWRGHRQHVEWRKLRSAALVVQRWWRLVQRRRHRRRRAAARHSAATYVNAVSGHRSSATRHGDAFRAASGVGARQLDAYLRRGAAVVLQSAWRGRQCRRRLERARAEHGRERLDRAATCIQRAVRRHCARRRRRRAVLATANAAASTATRIYDPAAGIPDARRLELQREITRFRAANPAAFVDVDDMQQRHGEAGDAWREYRSVRAPNAERLLRRMDMLSARVHTDLDTLTALTGRPLRRDVVDAGSGDDDDSDRRKGLASHSAAVRSVARQAHKRMLARQKLSWWQRETPDSAADWPV